jgi:cullin 1
MATEKYYRAESAAFVQNNSVADYLKKAEARLAEEMKRVDMYLHDSSRREVSQSCLLLDTVADGEKLKEVCEKVLITEHKDLMVEEFQNLLDLDRTDGMFSRHCGSSC